MWYTLVVLLIVLSYSEAYNGAKTQDKLSIASSTGSGIALPEPSQEDNTKPWFKWLRCVVQPLAGIKRSNFYAYQCYWKVVHRPLLKP